MESTQVAIAPEKDDIFITINLREGEVYTVGEVKLAGTMKVPEAELRRLLLVQPGQTYSRKLITQTQEFISFRLGVDGYAFAKIDPVPQANEETKTIDLTFFVDSGSRAYVRRINFINTSAIDDEVLRREMRQMEGSYLSNSLLERSKERLQRLPYIETGRVRDRAGARHAGPRRRGFRHQGRASRPVQRRHRVFGGAGVHAERQLRALELHGLRRARGARNSDWQVLAAVQHLAHRSVHQTSTAFRARRRCSTATSRSMSPRRRTSRRRPCRRRSSTAIRSAEFQGLRFGVIAQRSDLIVNPQSSAPEAVTWVRNNGNPYTRVIERAVDVPGDDDPTVIESILFGTKFDTFELVGGWYYDSRNRAIFADRGVQHSASLAVTAPGSEVDYYTFRYDYLQLVPIFRQWTLAFAAELAYGDAIGDDTTSLPPYRQFFAGGPGSVRGFTESRLGPKDGFGNPYGGNMKVIGRAELLFPVPAKWRASTRISAFFDMGNVFSQGSAINFVGQDGRTPVDYEFDYNELKQSAGIAIQWMAPLGVFRFSYGFPLNEFEGDGIRYEDEVERFQFTIGSAF